MMIAKADPPPEDESGGIGGGSVIDPRTSRRDIALIGRAIRLGFPMNKSKRREVVGELLSVMRNDPESRTRVAAARTLVAAHAANIKLMAMDQADEHHAKGTKVTHEHVGTIGIDARTSEVNSICLAALERRGEDKAARPGNGDAAIDAG